MTALATFLPARLNVDLVRQLAESFPGEPWQMIFTRGFIADRREQFRSDWSQAKHLEEVGGVYAMLLPVAWFSTPRTLPLHAPDSHQGEKIPFEFIVPELADGYGVVYVGRTANLLQRWQGHLRPGERKDGGQVKFGLFDCGLHCDVNASLRALREHGRIIYTVQRGPEQCANRDILEMSLCARFAPPFNIKSEH